MVGEEGTMRRDPVWWERAVGFWSLGGVLFAALALLLTRTLHSVTPPPDVAAVCDSLPPLAVSLPENLPSPIAPTPGPTPAPPAGATVTPTATPVATATPAATAAVPMRTLFRADDLPSSHGLRPVQGPIVPLVIPPPCQVPDPRARRLSPCAKLLPPGATLCVQGVVGLGQIGYGAEAPRLALQADRVQLRDLDGALRLDELQGYVRYDDPQRGLLLVCPNVALLDELGPNARRIVALCTNRGQEGWAISGQVTDGNAAAPDSVSLTIDAPDGTRILLVGGLATGAIVVRGD
jgi:hypothetical protein